MSKRTPPSARLQRRCDETGGAVTLMVILMVPVLVLAAVAAAAVPRRLAAQSAADAAAGNLASLTAAWRDAQARDHGPVDWFFPDCVPADGHTPHGDPTAAELESARVCKTLTRSVLAALSARGFDGADIAGFYSSSYTAPAQAATPDSEHPISLPCRTGGRTVIADAVHLGLAGDWGATGWAEAQIWPNGLRIASEAIGTVTAPTTSQTSPNPVCGDLLDLVPLDDRPDRNNAARRFAESLPTRTAFGH